MCELEVCDVSVLYTVMKDLRLTGHALHAQHKENIVLHCDLSIRVTVSHSHEIKHTVTQFKPFNQHKNHSRESHLFTSSHVWASALTCRLKGILQLVHWQTPSVCVIQLTKNVLRINNIKHSHFQEKRESVSARHLYLQHNNPFPEAKEFRFIESSSNRELRCCVKVETLQTLTTQTSEHSHWRIHPLERADSCTNPSQILSGLGNVWRKHTRHRITGDQTERHFQIAYRNIWNITCVKIFVQKTLKLFWIHLSVL